MVPELVGDIHLHNVTFGYQNRAPVFEDLTLHPRRGTIMSIVGESGAGKNTLLSLLQGLYLPDGSGITTGGLDVQYLQLESLRRVVGIVPQQIDLFSGTVLDNIVRGEVPDMLRVVGIYQQFGLLGFIEQLPGRFATVLGERGAGLSNGQKQRLAIARALYPGPGILLFDEATAVLDSAAEHPPVPGSASAAGRRQNRCARGPPPGRRDAGRHHRRAGSRPVGRKRHPRDQLMQAGGTYHRIWQTWCRPRRWPTTAPAPRAGMTQNTPPAAEAFRNGFRCDGSANQRALAPRQGAEAAHASPGEEPGRRWKPRFEQRWMPPAIRPPNLAGPSGYLCLARTFFIQTTSTFLLPMKLSRVAIAALVLLLLAVLLTVLAQTGQLALPTAVPVAARWAALGALALAVAPRRSLTGWIVLSMLVGIEIGHDFPAVALNLKVLSDAFLRLVKTIIAPLVFATLVVGIAGHANLKQVGRMGLKALIYFEVVTTFALFIGLAAINFTKAGVGIKHAAITEKADVIVAAAPQTTADIILHIFPENIAKSVAEGQVLQVVVFAILFAIGLALSPERPRRVMLEICESLSEVMFKFTNVVMFFAPLGVGGAMAYTVAKMGFGPLLNAFQLLLTLYGALIGFVLLVLLPVALLMRIPLRRFMAAVAEPVSIAFATTSSEAALPRAMEAMESIGVPRRIVAFVMPTGYSFNLDGTTLYLSLASVFVAQAAGVNLSFGDQMLLVFTLMLTSKGVAGVPRASLVILLATLPSFNLPAWPVFIILGIDALMDMARTAVNVLGNCLASAVVARWEGEFIDDYQGPDPAALPEPIAIASH